MIIYLPCFCCGGSRLLGHCVSAATCQRRKTVPSKTLHRCYSDVVPPAAVEGTEKEYPTKIKNLVDEIGKLTLLEVSDLNELLKVWCYCCLTSRDVNQL